jgi:hypothetical protein
VPEFPVPLARFRFNHFNSTLRIEPLTWDNLVTRPNQPVSCQDMEYEDAVAA